MEESIDQNHTKKPSKKWFKPQIDKNIFKVLTKTSDLSGWKHIVIFISSLIFLGYACNLTWGTWYFIPVYLAYCTFWGGADAIWHECGHRTAFKSRRLNDIFYYMLSI